MNPQMLIGAPCSRCTSVFIGCGDWNVSVKHGYVIGLVCPKCLTAEENAEAVINEATIDYSTDEDGRLLGKPKGTEN